MLRVKDLGEQDKRGWRSRRRRRRASRRLPVGFPAPRSVTAARAVDSVLIAARAISRKSSASSASAYTSSRSPATPSRRGPLASARRAGRPRAFLSRRALVLRCAVLDERARDPRANVFDPAPRRRRRRRRADETRRRGTATRPTRTRRVRRASAGAATPSGTAAHGNVLAVHGAAARVRPGQNVRVRAPSRRRTIRRTLGTSRRARTGACRRRGREHLERSARVLPRRAPANGAPSSPTPFRGSAIHRLIDRGEVVREPRVDRPGKAPPSFASGSRGRVEGLAPSRRAAPTVRCPSWARTGQEAPRRGAQGFFREHDSAVPSHLPSGLCGAHHRARVRRPSARAPPSARRGAARRRATAPATHMSVPLGTVTSSRRARTARRGSPRRAAAACFRGAAQLGAHRALNSAPPVGTMSDEPARRRKIDGPARRSQRAEGRVAAGKSDRACLVVGDRVAHAALVGREGCCTYHRTAASPGRVRRVRRERDGSAIPCSLCAARERVRRVDPRVGAPLMPRAAASGATPGSRRSDGARAAPRSPYTNRRWRRVHAKR